jgi:hypothetical protein
VLAVRDGSPVRDGSHSFTATATEPERTAADEHLDGFSQQRLRLGVRTSFGDGACTARERVEGCAESSEPFVCQRADAAGYLAAASYDLARRSAVWPACVHHSTVDQRSA